MKSGGGKQKGGAFERATCKQLSLWLSGGVRDDLLWRSAMSGGRATIGFKRGKMRKSQSGDISGIDTQGQEFTKVFSVECKHYSSLNMESLVFARTGNLAKFWNQACRDASLSGKAPLLIAKQNSRPTLLVAYTGDLHNYFDRVGKRQPTIQIRLKREGRFYIFLFDEFLANYQFRCKE